MSKSNRKRRIEAKNKADAKKFWMIVGISTLVIMLLLFLMFANI